MRDTTAFISESMGACHLLAFVVDATTEGAYALEYEKADPGRHKSDSWHGRRDPWKRYMLAADVNARDGNERAEHALFRDVLVPRAKAHGLAVTCGVGRYHVNNHSIGDGLHLHVDVGHWANLGDRPNTPKGYIASWVGRTSLPPWPVRAFQKQHGLVVDGIPGKKTTTALQEVVGAKPDGLWGPLTTKAIQRKVKTTPDGVCGPNTYYGLGLMIEGGCK